MLKISKTKVYCFDPHFKSYKLMGNLIGDTFYKRVEPVHYMRVVDGYGFQYAAFSEFAQHGVKKIHITERHTGNSWESTLEEWNEHGHIADYGRGKQIFMSLKYMSKVDKAQAEKDKMKKELLRSETKVRAL